MMNGGFSCNLLERIEPVENRQTVDGLRSLRHAEVLLEDANIRACCWRNADTAIAFSMGVRPRT